MSTTTYSSNNVLNAVAAAAKVLDERKEEVNRLNVFPVPDGDTGTNMSLTIQSVVSNVANLPIGASGADIRKAVTTGALMGARGNSGVITSQILRGLCEGSQGFDEFDVESIAGAFDRAREVAFQAVRKPVEGTILTVLRDSAAAAKVAVEQELSIPEALDAIVAEAYASVQRTPDLLPVLKEHGVVDAGGFGLAILFDAFTAALLGRSGTMVDEMSFARGSHPKVEIEQVNDWEGSRYRYCNEFLVDSDTLDKDAALEFLSTMGDCELCVGEVPKFKVHVHSDHPDQVLKYFLDHGQISEVFIHNMQIQSAERTEKLAAEEQAERKPLGFVAVAAGSGQAEILKSLGVDVIVSGGQTMNPSTKDLLDAAGSVNADAVIILPNNSNIIMAANSAAELSETPCAVVPTKSVPQAFSALVRRGCGCLLGNERRGDDRGRPGREDRRGHLGHPRLQGRRGQPHRRGRRHRHRRRLHRGGGRFHRRRGADAARQDGRRGRRYLHHFGRRGLFRRGSGGARGEDRGSLRRAGS